METLEHWGNFINYVAYKFRDAGRMCSLEIQDLVQAGYEGLIKAQRKVNSNVEECERAQYIRTRIYGSIIDAIRDFSINSRKQFEEFKLSGDTTQLYTVVSFDSDSFPRATEPTVLTSLIAYELIFRSNLTAFERHLVRLYFIDGCSMLEIAECFGYTESRISQLMSEILAKIRTANNVKSKKYHLRGGRSS